MKKFFCLALVLSSQSTSPMALHTIPLPIAKEQVETCGEHCDPQKCGLICTVAAVSCPFCLYKLQSCMCTLTTPSNSAFTACMQNDTNKYLTLASYGATLALLGICIARDHQGNKQKTLREKLTQKNH